MTMYKQFWQSKTWFNRTMLGWSIAWGGTGKEDAAQKTKDDMGMETLNGRLFLPFFHKPTVYLLELGMQSHVEAVFFRTTFLSFSKSVGCT